MVQLGSGPILSHTSILNDPELRKIQPELAAFAKYIDSHSDMSRPPIPEYSILQETLGTIGHEGLSGKITVGETMKRIQERMDKVMKRAGYY